MEKNKTGKYFKYAIGEIVLVVIGILIALQINNWNEKNKMISVKMKSYENLISNLRKDSLILVRIIDLQSKSLNAQNKFIKYKFSDITNNSSSDSLNKMLFDVYKGAYSFFPNYGNYNSLVSNKGLDLIESQNIKSNLIDLYDYECKRYEFVDNVLDAKFMNDFIPFIQRKIGFFVDSDFNYEIIDKFQVEKEYLELQLQCQNLNPMTNNSYRMLLNIQSKVNVLLSEITTELNE